MEVLAAVLFGILFSAGLYFLMVYLRTRRTVAERISGATTELHFPYPVTDADTKKLRKKHYEKTALTAILYEAGVRSENQIKFFYFRLSLCVVAPVLFMILMAIGGQMDSKMGVRAVSIGSMLVGYNFLALRMGKIRRQKKIIQGLPQFVDLMVVCVEAGLAFTAALQRVLAEMDQNDPLTQEFSLMYNEYLSGLSIREACERLMKRCKSPDLQPIVSTVVQSDQMGSSLGRNLRIQSRDLRDKTRQRLREKAHKIPVKMIFPTGLIFINIFILMLGPVFFQLKSSLGD